MIREVWKRCFFALPAHPCLCPRRGMALVYTCESERMVFTMGFLWPSLGFLCLWAGFLVSLCGIHLSPVLPMGFHRARTKHILLLSTGEEKNPTSATSCYKKNSLRFYGGWGDMMSWCLDATCVCEGVDERRRFKDWRRLAICPP